MFILTKKEDNFNNGVYATIDTEGTQVVQFFVDKDDAECYNTHLESLGVDLHVTEIEDDEMVKFCDVIGCAYSVVEPGELVIPRVETLQMELQELFNND